MQVVLDVLHVTVSTVFDVLPIVAIIFGFQALVIRRPIPHLRQVVIGFVYVLLGLALFLVGLEEALFPLGKLMAQQLTDPVFIHGGLAAAAQAVHWQDYKWGYAFAAALGFATTIAEPSLIAVAIKAHEVSGGTIGVWGLRIAVALGVALGIALGTFRIVTGTPLHYYIVAGYILVILQTLVAPRIIIALAYDSGGVTTSVGPKKPAGAVAVINPVECKVALLTVTPPMVTTVPGRSALLDGFGLIAFASLFPMITVMGYAQLSHWRFRRSQARNTRRGG